VELVTTQPEQHEQHNLTTGPLKPCDEHFYSHL